MRERARFPATQIPDEDRPQPVQYDGHVKLRAAYVMDRMPKLHYEKHSVEWDFMELTLDHNQFFARHRWTEFADYYEEWKKIRAKQSGSKKKTTETSSGGRTVVRNKKSEVIFVPNPPELTEKQQLDKEKLFGRTTMTPNAENWLKTWQPQRRYTKADFNDNRKAINRKLTERLFLIVQDKRTGKWKFPDAVRENPLTMRQAAQRKFEGDMQRRCMAYFVSHSPMAHYEKKSQDGAAESDDQTFFYHCVYLAGRPPFRYLEKKHGWVDHAWVTKHEALEYDFIDLDYKQVVYDMLQEGSDRLTGTDRNVNYNTIMPLVEHEHAEFSRLLAEKDSLEGIVAPVKQEMSKKKKRRAAADDDE